MEVSQMFKKTIKCITGFLMAAVLLLGCGSDVGKDSSKEEIIKWLNTLNLD